MKITASTYDEARGLLDDPELEPDLRAELQSEISAYEQQQQVGRSPAFAEPTGTSALEASGSFTPPKPDRELSLKPQALGRAAGGLAKRGRAAVTGLKEGFPEAPLPSLEESNAALGGGSLDDAIQEALAGTENISDEYKLAMGVWKRDDKYPSASKLEHLYAPPEFVPPNAGFTDLMTSYYHLEPPIEVARAALKDDKLTTADEKYKRFADAMWSEKYAEAERTGKPAVRVDYMNTDDWLSTTVKASQKAASKVFPFITGADRSMLFGLGTKAASKITGALPGAPSAQELERDMIAHEEASPVATGAGAVAGALSPTSAVSRVFGGVSKSIAPAGSGLARRLGGAVAGGAVSGAAESLGTDVVRSDVTGMRPEEMATRAMLSGGFGGLGGAAGELIGTGAGALVKRNRANPETGPLLAQAEAGGMTTGPLAKSKELVDIERANPGRHIEDVLSEPITRKVGQQRLKAQTDVIRRHASENAAMESQLSTQPMEELRFQVWKEYDRMVDNPHASDAARNELLTLLERLTDPVTIQRMKRENGLAGRDFQKAFAGSFLDAHHTAPARELFADDFNRMVNSLSETAARADISEPDAWKRILGSAMKIRDKYPGYFRVEGDRAIHEPMMIKGDVVAPEGSMSATKMRHDLERSSQIDQNKVLGLPSTLKPKAENFRERIARDRSLLAEPDLDAQQSQALNGIIQNYKRAPNTEAQTAALEEAAQVGGFMDELKLLAANRSYKKLRELSSLRAVAGTQGRLGLFTSKPGQALALKADPVARMLSRQAPNTAELPPLSGGLRDFLSRITGRGRTRGALDPLAEMQMAGRGSARQLGPALGAGEKQRRDLTPEELLVLQRLVEAATQDNRQAAGGL